MQNKILDGIWFGNIGIIAVDSDGNGWKCYIGTTGDAGGMDEGVDAQFVAAFGHPTGRAIALAAFPGQSPEKYLR